MILTRSPLRITLAGGGTDLPSYYRLFGGRVISAAINKYVYVAASKPFSNEYILKYSKLEKVDVLDDIQHPIIREALKLFTSGQDKVELSILADVPSGTGLGSSGSFTCALLSALNLYFDNSMTKKQLADTACNIEIEKLGEPVGKQDQFISSFGGIRIFDFNLDDSTEVTDMNLGNESLFQLERNIQLFYTGKSRSASQLLTNQNTRSLELDEEILSRLHRIKEQSHDIEFALKNGNGTDFAEILNLHWQEKKSRTPGMTNSTINFMHEYSSKNGAIGAKVVGAGGGGFLLTYSLDPEKLSSAMASQNFRELEFAFDMDGTKELVS